MAPPNRQDLDTSVQYIKGVGPKRGEILESEGIKTVYDLLYYFPRRHLDRTTVSRIKDLQKNNVTTVIGKVEAKGMRTSRRRKYFQVIVNDGTGFLNCVWFNGIKYMENVFSVDDVIAFHGKIDFYNGYQIVHPEYDKLETDESEPLHTGAVIPLYHSTQALKSVGLDSRGFRKIIKHTLDVLNQEEFELLPLEIRKENKLISLKEALNHIHFSPDKQCLMSAGRRLKFDEHFFLQLLMALRKVGITESLGRSFTQTGPYLKLIYDDLDFELTGAQKNVLRDIRNDLSSPRVMNRLLQGDVGSGKTIVAILSSAIVVGNNAQVAVMAPTEILAHQHYQVFKQYFDKTHIVTAILVGKQKSKERNQILEGIATGKIQIIVGTHALIQEDVRFRDLGYVIIDEQQRFGVIQRGLLVDKGYNPDVLIMTATPIPRTLAITYHGDMDLSIIDELPKNRLPVVTRVVSEDTLTKVYEFIREQLSKGRQCIVVYPLIEESEKSDLKAAVEGFTIISDKIFPEFSVSIIHGRMKKEEKDKIMDLFGRNKVNVLVSTTVIEVGIDIPNATVMVIENAERFGLTQLHQLRGRIGRGSEKGYCILIQRKITQSSKKRLAIISKTNNGFEISDEDLKLRGPGEFFSTRQHGYIRWKIADLVTDGPIIRQARNAAFSLVEEDPQLRKPEHLNIRKRFLEEYQHMLEYVNIG